MKKSIKKSLAILLTVLLLAGAVPFSGAYASGVQNSELPDAILGFGVSGSPSSSVTMPHYALSGMGALNANVPWTASSDSPSWLTVSPTSSMDNNQFAIHVTDNTSTASRIGTITFSGGGLTATYVVTQRGVPTLTIDMTTWSPASAASSVAVNVDSNTTWNVSSNASAWLTASLTSGSNSGMFTIFAAVNTSSDARNGTITVSVGDIARTISVTQAGAAGTSSISASPNTLHFGTHPYGYSQIPTQTVTITNVGTQNVTLNPLPSVTMWTLTADANWTTAMAPGQTRSFTIRPSLRTSKGTVLLLGLPKPSRGTVPLLALAWRL